MEKARQRDLLLPILLSSSPLPSSPFLYVINSKVTKKRYKRRREKERKETKNGG